MNATPRPSDIPWCADECLRCYRVCLQTAMTHCLEAGGRHVEPEHFRTMMNCARLCQTAAEFMLSRSTLHAAVCAACAQVCDACAASCERIGDMEECVKVCRSCADQCRRMSAGADPEQAPLLNAQQASAEAGQLRM
jgi:hypothetical protein